MDDLYPGGSVIDDALGRDFSERGYNVFYREI
jgi:hypothetical protein